MIDREMIFLHVWNFPQEYVRNNPNKSDEVWILIKYVRFLCISCYYSNNLEFSFRDVLHISDIKAEFFDSFPCHASAMKALARYLIELKNLLPLSFVTLWHNTKMLKNDLIHCISVCNWAVFSTTLTEVFI